MQSQLQKWAGKTQAEVEFQYSQEMTPGELGLGPQDTNTASSKQKQLTEQV